MDVKGKIIITAAVTGSRPTKEQNPAVPHTPKEIIGAAVECHKAGAAIAHIHVRHPKTGKPDFRTELFRRVLEGIRERCDMVVNLTTSGLFIKSRNAIYQRLQPIFLKPEICSLDVGSMNFSDLIFANPPQWSRAAAMQMKVYGVKPEIEVFDTGHISQALDLIEDDLIVDPPYFQLCMGVRWGIEASMENLLLMKSKLPPKAIWSVLGVGKKQFPIIQEASFLGGHIRVGLEDNIFLSDGVLAKSNAELVEKAVNMALNHGREIATPDDARHILKLTQWGRKKEGR